MKFINFFKKEHPKKKYIYAVTGGKYLGELLVFIESDNINNYFLSLPEMHVREIPSDKFKFGLNENIVDIVEKLPSDIYKVCIAQYNKNKKIDLTNSIVK